MGLSQGDIIDECPILVWKLAPPPLDLDVPPEIRIIRIVVLTQACDLAQGELVVLFVGCGGRDFILYHFARFLSANRLSSRRPDRGVVDRSTVSLVLEDVYPSGTLLQFLHLTEIPGASYTPLSFQEICSGEALRNEGNRYVRHTGLAIGSSGHTGLGGPVRRLREL
jgi:hypothetical protein